MNGKTLRRWLVAKSRKKHCSALMVFSAVRVILLLAFAVRIAVLSVAL